MTNSFPFLLLENKNTSIKEFITFWNGFYVPYDTELYYTETIVKISFNQLDIEKLFEWKNGMKINGNVNKQKSIDKILSKLTIINNLKCNFDIKIFEQNFIEISAIWQIFLLHIIQPNIYPIFDQHVFRTHVYLMKKIICEIPNYKQNKLDYYFENYMPFFNSLKTEVDSIREIDTAFWTFGKFLKSDYAKLLLN